MKLVSAGAFAFIEHEAVKTPFPTTKIPIVFSKRESAEVFQYPQIELILCLDTEKMRMKFCNDLSKAYYFYEEKPTEGRGE